MAPRLRFFPGEKVLCYHGPLVYEAKCLECSVSRDRHVKYLIHYAGWNKNWDEWVPESRVLKYNEANIQKQKEVEKAHNALSAKSKKSKIRRTDTSPSKQNRTPTKEPEKEKKKEKEKEKPKETFVKDASPVSDVISVESDTDESTDRQAVSKPAIEIITPYVKKPNFIIKVPVELKWWLVDDEDLINRQQKLIKLPARLTVSSFLNKYLDCHSGKDRDEVSQFVIIIKRFFNATLGSQLLYKFERPQYGEICQNCPSLDMSDMYGVIHLLRLVVAMRDIVARLLACTSFDEKVFEEVVAQVPPFLKFIASGEKNEFFDMSDYENPPPEYHRKNVTLNLS